MRRAKATEGYRSECFNSGVRFIYFCSRNISEQYGENASPWLIQTTAPKYSGFFYSHFSHGKRFYNCNVVRGDMGILWTLRGAIIASVGIFATK